MNSVMHMSWSCSAYHGHLMSLKRLSSHRLAQTGLQKANACIVSGYYSASFSGQHKIDWLRCLFSFYVWKNTHICMNTHVHITHMQLHLHMHTQYKYTPTHTHTHTYTQCPQACTHTMHTQQ